MSVDERVRAYNMVTFVTTHAFHVCVTPGSVSLSITNNAGKVCVHRSDRIAALKLPFAEPNSIISVGLHNAVVTALHIHGFF